MNQTRLQVYYYIQEQFCMPFLFIFVMREIYMLGGKMGERVAEIPSSPNAGGLIAHYFLL